MELFYKNNKNLSVILFCLFISVSIWTSMSLSKTYNEVFKIPIEYSNVPIDKNIENDSLILKVRIKASGWDLITKSINNKILKINLEEYPIDNSINFSNTKSLISEQFKEIEVIEVIPPYYVLKFNILETKKIPIRLKITENLATNFHLSGIAISKPDSILVSSDEKTLKSLYFIETEGIELSEKDTLLKNIKLNIPKNVNSTIKKVDAFLKIEEFAEKEITIKVNIDNKPNNIDIIIYPENVTLKCLVPFSKFEKTTSSDFYISVEYEDIQNSKNNKVHITLKDEPIFVKNIQIDNEKVEFILYLH